MTRCLTKQPGGVSHLDLLSCNLYSGTFILDTCNLIDLRCVNAVVCCDIHECAPGCGVP